MKDTLLLHLDVGPAGALWRVALGLLFTLGTRASLPQAGHARTAAALLGVLFLVKVLAAVGRRLTVVPPGVSAAWTWRRALARDHDSYQWRKLVWVGLGILAAGLLAPPRAPWELGLGGACLLSGLVAEALWRRKGLPSAPPVRT
jgi:hypothetical protein